MSQKTGLFFSTQSVQSSLSATSYLWIGWPGSDSKPRSNQDACFSNLPKNRKTAKFTSYVDGKDRAQKVFFPLFLLGLKWAESAERLNSCFRVIVARQLCVLKGYVRAQLEFSWRTVPSLWMHQSQWTRRSFDVTFGLCIVRRPRKEGRKSTKTSHCPCVCMEHTGFLPFVQEVRLLWTKTIERVSVFTELAKLSVNERGSKQTYLSFRIWSKCILEVQSAIDLPLGWNKGSIVANKPILD